MMKTLIATAILTMSFSAMSANDECIDLASLDADAAAQLARFDADVAKDRFEKLAAVERDANAALKTNPESPRAMSCFDRFSKMNFPFAFAIPTLGDIVGGLAAQACSVVDQKIAEKTQGIGASGQMPYGLGSVNVGAPRVGAAGGGYNVGKGGVTGSATQSKSGSVADAMRGMFR